MATELSEFKASCRECYINITTVKQQITLLLLNDIEIWDTVSLEAKKRGISVSQTKWWSWKNDQVQRLR